MEKEESTGKTRITIPFKNLSPPVPPLTPFVLLLLFLRHLFNHLLLLLPLYNRARYSDRPFPALTSFTDLPPHAANPPSKDSICKTPACIIIIIVHGVPLTPLAQPASAPRPLVLPDIRGGVVSPPTFVDRVVHGPRLQLQHPHLRVTFARLPLCSPLPALLPPPRGTRGLAPAFYVLRRRTARASERESKSERREGNRGTKRVRERECKRERKREREGS